ncbi:isoprenylcysteine carboxylmethyltransferase family protein, partial [Mycobacteroides abscessus subsp. abscessus]
MAIAYAVISYVLFLASFLYLIAFVGNMMVPCTIDNGLPAPTLEALVVDGVLLSLFLAVHSVMARTWFQVLVDPVCV